MCVGQKLSFLERLSQKFLCMDCISGGMILMSYVYLCIMYVYAFHPPFQYLYLYIDIDIYIYIYIDIDIYIYRYIDIYRYRYLCIKIYKRCNINQSMDCISVAVTAELEAKPDCCCCC